MKRIAMATLVLCLFAVSQVMAQTTTTTTSTSGSKPAASPTTNTTAKPAAKPAPKYVFEGDGTGTWRGGEGAAHANRGDGENHWPTPSYETSNSSEEGQQTGVGSQTSGAVSSSGSSRRLRCLGPEKRPCTEWNVQELHRRLEERRGEHPALARIRHLDLESSDGALSCRQEEGEHCTSEQIRALNEHVAEPLHCAIYYGGTSTTTNNGSGTQTHSGTTLVAGGAWQSGASTTSTNSTSTTTSGSSTTPTGTAYVPGGAGTTTNQNSSTQNHGSTTQNHTATTGSHTTVSQNQTTATAAAAHHRPAPPVQKHD